MKRWVASARGGMLLCHDEEVQIINLPALPIGFALTENEGAIAVSGTEDMNSSCDG